MKSTKSSTMSKIAKKLLFLVPALFWVATPSSLGDPPSSFAVAAATSPSGPFLFTPMIVLAWPEAIETGGTKPITRFNLYRKIDPSAPYPRFPLNSKPLQVLDDCVSIEDALGFESAEWKLIATALSVEDVSRFDPCDIAKVERGSNGFRLLETLAAGSWRISRALGQAYLDLDTAGGKTYYYELRGVAGSGSETVLASDIKVKAGAPDALTAPKGLASIAGDGRVLLHWDTVPLAFGFNVYRSTASSGTYNLVNSLGVTARVALDFDEKAIASDGKPVDGFLDAQRFDPSGEPIAHEVAGFLIDGPMNGTKYSYRVAAVDLLGNEGSLSATVAATPLDRTPPRSPADVTVTADEPASALEVRWGAVGRDALGHTEAGIKAYRVYRYEKGDDPTAGATAVSGDIAPPFAGAKALSFRDGSPVLRPTFGERNFFYRIECVDAAGNVSARSAGVSGHLKDITAPASPKGLAAEGLDAQIRVTWNVSAEPDLDGYEVYRSLCDAGSWPCAKDSRTEECANAWTLLGYISQDEAAAMGKPTFVDTSKVLVDSPVCYAYLVKALDTSENKSGAWPPNPLPPALEPYVCQRVRDRSPPEAAVITGLSARDKAILVAWVGAPVQDIAAWYVYRSTSATGPGAFVGGMTVVEPPAKPVMLPDKLSIPAAAGCGTIPLAIHEGMSAGSFLDTGVEPKRVFWYRVVGVDQAGNETPTERAVPVSTFTYSTEEASVPSITSVAAASTPSCGLLVRWTPAFDGSAHRGFAVFRAEMSTGIFRQVGSLFSKKSEYHDPQVIRGRSYLYRVVQVDKDGKTSSPSTTFAGVLP